MPNLDHVVNLKKGRYTWKKWREDNPGVEIDLSGANLTQASLDGLNLSGADLSYSLLSHASLRHADLSYANLKNAKLTRADLSAADLCRANLSGANLKNVQHDIANLREANLTRANLEDSGFWQANLRQANLKNARLSGAAFDEADLTGADLRGADLRGAYLTGAKIDKAKVSTSWIHAVNVWDLEGEFDEQEDLIITRNGKPIITVDNLKVAQFIYLILNNRENLILDNEEKRNVINSLTSKSVLIVGRFVIPERKKILDAIRYKLRESIYCPFSLIWIGPPIRISRKPSKR
jgi:uncharacterized protein YjbI with pentapeptide repeats